MSDLVETQIVGFLTHRLSYEATIHIHFFLLSAFQNDMIFCLSMFEGTFEVASIDSKGVCSQSATAFKKSLFT